MEASLANAMGGLDVNAGVGGERAERNGNGSNTPREPLSISQQPVKKKKKKKSKPKNPKPSGFEESHAEGPLTPEAAREESQLYHPLKPFSERIEICVQRYKAKRKFDPMRAQLLTSYLHLGGISTGPKQFSGGLDIKNSDLNSEEIAAMEATDFVQNMEQDEGWEVDFAYIVRGFLSHKVPYVLGYLKIEHLELAAQFVRNFLNYVLYHNVAPEYQDSVHEALKICDLAEKELPLCCYVSRRLPGDFNMACSTLYDGFYAGMRSDAEVWDDITLNQPVGLTPRQATEIFSACVEKRGTARQQEIGLDARAVKAEYLGMEVTGVILPSQEKAKEKEREDQGDSKEDGYKPTGPKALGKLLVKVWVAEGQARPDTDLDEFEIWLETDVLQYCFVGMHIEAKVHSLSSGIIWIDNVTAVQTSFYLFLETPPKDNDDSDAEYDSD